MLMNAYKHDLSEFPSNHKHKHGAQHDAEAKFEARLTTFYTKYHKDKLEECHKIAKHYWKHEEVCKPPLVSPAGAPAVMPRSALSPARSLCIGMGYV